LKTERRGFEKKKTILLLGKRFEGKGCQSHIERGKRRVSFGKDREGRKIKGEEEVATE